jgi:hypothetical protein
MSKSTRPNIPDNVKLKLWSLSGGRCQFRGCNKPLYEEGLTLTSGNFADMAHIIGASNDGPRGGDNSSKLAKDIENLMLLCKEHHRLVDHEGREAHTKAVLRSMKEEHEVRVETLLEIHGDDHKTTAATCLVNIGDRRVGIDKAEIANAISPRYPVDRKGIVYTKDNFDLDASPDTWELAAKEIARNVEKGLEGGFMENGAKHLSLFGIGPMPLLMYWGKCIGSTVSGRVHQKFRGKAAPRSWVWDSPDTGRSSLIFKLETLIPHSTGKPVLLVLALSDHIAEDKYKNLLENNPGCAVYQITVPSPTSEDLLRTDADLESFRKTYREALNLIQKDCGNGCIVYLLPAVPASVAIECGRALLPTKDPTIIACQYYTDDRGFVPVLNLTP